MLRGTPPGRPGAGDGPGLHQVPGNRLRGSLSQDGSPPARTAGGAAGPAAFPDAPAARLHFTLWVPPARPSVFSPRVCEVGDASLCFGVRNTPQRPFLPRRSRLREEGERRGPHLWCLSGRGGPRSGAGGRTCSASRGRPQRSLLGAPSGCSLRLFTLSPLRGLISLGLCSLDSRRYISPGDKPA